MGHNRSFPKSREINDSAHNSEVFINTTHRHSCPYHEKVVFSFSVSYRLPSFLSVRRLPDDINTINTYQHPNITFINHIRSDCQSQASLVLMLFPDCDVG